MEAESVPLMILRRLRKLRNERGCWHPYVRDKDTQHNALGEWASVSALTDPALPPVLQQFSRQRGCTPV